MGDAVPRAERRERSGSLVPLLVFGVIIVVRADQRQMPRRSPAVSLEITLGFRGEEGGPDSPELAGLEIVLAVRARTPGLDLIILSGELHVVRPASPDGRVRVPCIAPDERHPPRSEVIAAALACPLRNERCQVR